MPGSSRPFGAASLAAWCEVSGSGRRRGLIEQRGGGHRFALRPTLARLAAARRRSVRRRRLGCVAGEPSARVFRTLSRRMPVTASREVGQGVGGRGRRPRRRPRAHPRTRCTPRSAPPRPRSRCRRRKGTRWPPGAALAVAGRLEVTSLLGRVPHDALRRAAADFAAIVEK